MKKNYRFSIPIVAILIILDQATKLLIVRSVGLYESIPLIKGYVDLVHVRNRGIAFGIFNSPDNNTGAYLLIGMTVFAVVFLAFWLFRISGENRKACYALSLIIGGALGNLIDRIRFLEVIDFLSVHAGRFQWPAFNVADSAITVGTVFLAILLLMEGSKIERNS